MSVGGISSSDWLQVSEIQDTYTSDQIDQFKSAEQTISAKTEKEQDDATDTTDAVYQDTYNESLS